jgi:hypothetical protein
MRRLVLLAALAAVLISASPAAAKHMRSVTACGQSGCVTSEDRTLLTVFVDIGPPSDRPAHPVPFYRLKTRIQGSRYAGQGFWAPAADRLLAEDGTWLAVRPPVTRALARMTAGLAPRPAAQLPGFPDGPPAPTTNGGGVSAAPVIAAAAAGVLLVLVALTLRRARRRARGAQPDVARVPAGRAMTGARTSASVGEPTSSSS